MITNEIYYKLTNHSRLEHADITAYLHGYENTLYDKQEAIDTFGLLAKTKGFTKYLTLLHPVTGISYIVRLPKGCYSLADIPSEQLRFSWRTFIDGRTFVVITRWPL